MSSSASRSNAHAKAATLHPDAQDAIPGLPLDIVVTHVLGFVNLPDMKDLARLRAVSRSMCDAVASTGRQVKYFSTHTRNTQRHLVMRCRGSQGALQELHDRGRLCVQIVCLNAAEGGQLDVLRWARANGFPWDNRTCSLAAARGHLDVLQWARANRCEWDEFTCNNAAKGGYLDVLRWARANGCAWDERTCSWAAYAGHLDVVRWARANGCPWDKETCANAAEGGHLDVLQWARANRCPWDEETCVNAARERHLELLQWAHANGCPLGRPTWKVTALFGNLATLTWLRGSDVPLLFPNDIRKMARFNPRREVRQWALTIGEPQPNENAYEEDFDALRAENAEFAEYFGNLLMSANSDSDSDGDDSYSESDSEWETDSQGG